MKLNQFQETIQNDKFKGESSILGKNSISIGNELSFSLDLKLGDKIILGGLFGPIKTTVRKLKTKFFIRQIIFLYFFQNFF